MRRLFCAITTGFLLAVSTVLVAQQHPNVARGFDIGRSYQMNGIDDVNLFNGSLTVTIPVGQRYHVNGNLQYGLTLVYNSNVWDTIQDNGTNFTTYPNRRSNAGIGWLLSLGRLFPKQTFPVQESIDWNYESPDGALHDFVCSGLSPSCPDTSPYFYTTDGSYLRLVIHASDRTVEFPDGTSQVFQEMNKSTNPWTPQTGAGFWRLTQIQDRFGNAVNITYSTTSDYPEIWSINDGVRTQTVYFVPTPADSAGDPDTSYDMMLDHVVLATFGAPSQASRTWRLTYDTQWLGSGNPPHGRSSQYAVPLLTAVTLPPVANVSQVYSMRRADGTTFYGISADSHISNGVLFGMQLPTKGWIEWDYLLYTFFGAPDDAIARTFAVSQRRTLTPDQSATDTWSYNRQDSTKRTCVQGDGSGFTLNPEQLVVSVTSPEQNTSVHYFSIYQDPNSGIPCDVGAIPFSSAQYALPFSAGVTANFNGEQRYLSQETYVGTPSLTTSASQFRVTGDNRQRSEWAFYRGDMAGSEDAHVPESAHATRYEDDSPCPGTSEPCYSSVTRFLPDNVGHYRQTSTRGNFGAGNFATAFTNYTGVATGGEWLPNRFTEQCKVEESVSRGEMASQSCSALTAVTGGTILSGPFVKQFCFDSTSGFLTRQRALAGTAPDAHDLLAVFTPQNGNVKQEDYYGGDGQSLGTGSVCNATLPAASEYQIIHTYSNGSLATTYHRPAGSDPIIYEVNNVIDASTGLVSQSSDPATLTTSYSYDVLGRLTQLTRPGEAAVTATYTEATNTAGAKVVVEQDSTDAGTMQSTTIFDGFGRTSEEQQLMPSGTAKRDTQYNGSGWVTSVSEWEATPSNFTVFSNFDAFGRARTITPPGQPATTVAFAGIRRVARSVSVGETLSGGTVQPATAMTTEIYDRAGRLIEVDEPDTISKASYGYDAADRLTSVSMVDLVADPTSAHPQTRSFSYDGRGLLKSEQHPENGTTYYKNYDSRGHAGKKLAGSSYTAFDLKYEYDALERLTNVYQLLNRVDPPDTDTTQVVKHFTFATANDGTNYKQGKLEAATRKNYTPSASLGEIDVTETYGYSDSAGRLTDKTTAMTGPGGAALQTYTQSYHYNDAGLFSEIKYPTCTDPSLCASAPSMISSISPTYQNGLLKTVPDFATAITYDLNGMATEIDHPGAVNDHVTVDTNKLARPAQIQFQTYDPCASPLISLPATSQVAPGSTGFLQLTILNSPTSPLTYEWLWNGTLIAGETTGTCCAAAASTGTYTARLINSCGKGEASTAVTVCGSPTVTVTPASALYSGTPITLTAAASGCGTAFTYHWYVGDAPNTTTSIGTNSSTLAVSPTQTTHYWVRITDSGGHTGDSNSAIVTVPLPTPGPLSATFTSPNVTVSWGSSLGADHYQLQRLDHGVWGAPVDVFGLSVSYSLSAGITYVFHVRAVDSSGGSASNYTANDLATTMTFASIQAGVTTVAFSQFDQVLTAINCVRTANNDGQKTWRGILDDAGYTTTPVPASNGIIYAAHILALRNAMHTALGKVQVTDPGYTDSLASPTPIKAQHIIELQQRAQ
jgi:YD repeat-containing protein